MVQRYDIAEAPWGLAIDPEDDGEWVKWEDIEDIIHDNTIVPPSLREIEARIGAKLRGNTTLLDFDTGNVYEVFKDGSKVLLYNEWEDNS